MFPFFNHYPGTNLHEIDLYYLLHLMADLEANSKELTAWKNAHEAEYQDLLDKVNGLIENLVDVIVPWDSSIAYHIFSIVEYQGTNYIAIQDVPVGVMITNTAYWQPANTVIEQINAMGTVVSDLQDNLYYTTPQEYGAVGDGIADDTGAIQAAVNNAKKFVYIKAGIYKVTSPIIIPSGVSIIGTTKSFIRVDAGFTGDYVFKINDQLSNFKIDTLYIQCNDMAVGGIYAARPYNMCEIRNVAIADTTVSAIHMGAGVDDVSQSLLIDNCIFLSSTASMSTEPLCVFNRVFELNLINTKVLYRQVMISTLPCCVFNFCWDTHISGCSFAFTSCAALSFRQSTRYLKIVGNTYENVGFTNAGDGTEKVDRIIEIISESGVNSNTGIIFDTKYYNCSRNIYLENAVQYMTVIGRFDFVTGGSTPPSRNNIITTDAGSESGNGLLGFNGSNIELSRIIDLKVDSENYLQMRHATTLPLELRQYLSGVMTAIFRLQNGNIYNLTNNGALVLKDSNGSSHFLRINTNGQVVVTNS